MEDDLLDPADLLRDLVNQAYVVIGTRTFRTYKLRSISSQAAICLPEAAIKIMTASASDLQKDEQLRRAFTELGPEGFFEHRIGPKLNELVALEETAKEKGEPPLPMMIPCRTAVQLVQKLIALHDPATLPCNEELGGPGLLLAVPMEGYMARKGVTLDHVITSLRYTVHKVLSLIKSAAKIQLSMDEKAIEGAVFQLGFVAWPLEGKPHFWLRFHLSPKERVSGACETLKPSMAASMQRRFQQKVGQVPDHEGEEKGDEHKDEGEARD